MSERGEKWKKKKIEQGMNTGCLYSFLETKNKKETDRHKFFDNI